MKFTQKYWQRSVHVAITIVLSVAALSAVVPQTAHAYGLLSNRSIMLSSTANGANNTAYQVSFTTTTNNQNIGSVVVEFCANSPILGDSCSLPDGFNTNYSSLSLTGVSGNITGMSVDTTNSTVNKVVLTRVAGQVANGPVTFALGDGVTNGISNPTTYNTTFYARIMTFSSTDGSGDESADSIDAGGIALSTANQLNVTAKVQEALSFCVYTQDTCIDGGNAVALGDVNGVLESTTTTYTSSAKFDVSSNAVSGVSVRLKGDTLKSGSFDISPYGNACTTDSTSSGTERFGLRMSGLGAGVTATAPYNCGSGSHGFDVANTTALYGQEIAKTSGATDVSTSTIELAAKSANTSEAGVYTTTLTLIATATY